MAYSMKVIRSLQGPVDWVFVQLEGSAVMRVKSVHLEQPVAKRYVIKMERTVSSLVTVSIMIAMAPSMRVSHRSLHAVSGLVAANRPVLMESLTVWSGNRSAQTAPVMRSMMTATES